MDEWQAVAVLKQACELYFQGGSYEATEKAISRMVEAATVLKVAQERRQAANAAALSRLAQNNYKSGLDD